MDDYLCIGEGGVNERYFKEKSLILSKQNKFNFNLKKMQSNLPEITRNILFG